MTNPLILTRDAILLDELQRLAAAAGVMPEVTGDPVDALRSWAGASVVIVGVDLADEVAAIEPPRRVGVHLVGWGRLPDEVFRTALALGAENAAELPRSESWVLEVLADSSERFDSTGVTIGVIGGSGGAGATTFACALAQTAARDWATCLLDIDPLGPGVDQVLGMERDEGIRWDALQQTTGRLGARALRDALPRRGRLGVLTFGCGGADVPETLQPFAARAAVAAATRGHQLVVLDLPRSGGGLTEELMARCQALVVVTRANLPGLSSAARFVARASQSGPLSLVIRGSGLDAAEAHRIVGAPVVAAMPDQRGLDEAIDLGQGPVKSRRGVLSRAARSVLEVLGPDAAGGRGPRPHPSSSRSTPPSIAGSAA
ncbi:septum site determining protein [Nocardioides sp. JQ2195]|uniref:septum site-determining protein Ssd n=1 Tax=Nocardioides sp. JQ2195 TaxID=2592334 RepID=UPI00143E6F96|nr:septum site-determining protein Ssd [Nocardioides sp. JQ2195]QIX28236.1 septum site determining protein [Nocardioides sp. JQ2195]